MLTSSSQWLQGSATDSDKPSADDDKQLGADQNSQQLAHIRGKIQVGLSAVMHMLGKH